MTIAAARDRIIRNPLLRRIGIRLRQFSRDLPRRIPIQKIPLLQRWSGRPVGRHLTVRDYLALHPGRGWEKVVREGGSYERVKPESPGPPLPARFDPPQTVRWNEERVTYMEGCRYWGEYGGAVIAHDECLIGELSPDVWGVERHAIFNKLKLPRLRPLPGLTAIVSTPEANTNYSHWLVDLMPRLSLLECAGFGPEKVDRYLVNMGGRHYEREMLSLAGVPPEKIHPVSAASHFSCERAVTASIRREHWQQVLPAWVPAYLRGIADANKPHTGSSRRLYLTRKTAAFRRVLNEDELVPVLKRHGFEIIDPGSLSVREQVGIFSNADVIVSPHSSGLTNLVFCRPGTTVLEIFPKDYFDVSFWTIATIAECRYHAVVGERPGEVVPETVIEARRQDIVLPKDMGILFEKWMSNVVSQVSAN